MPAFQDRTGWYIGASSYWFANSAKYFILMSLVLPKQVRELTPPNTHNTQWGLVLSVGAIWGIFGPAIFGYLSDRFGKKRLPFIAVSAALTLVAYGVLASASQLWMIFAGYLLLAVSDDVGQGSYQAVIPEVVPRDLRGRASGVMAALELTAQIAIVLIGVAIGVDPMPIYIALGVIHIICATTTILTLSGTTPIAVVEAERASLGFFQGWIRPLRTPDFRWVWATRFLLSLGFYLVYIFLQNYLTDRVTEYKLGPLTVPDNYGVLAIGLIISLSGAVGAVWAARSVDRLGRKRVVARSGLLMAALLVPFAFIPVYSVIAGLAVLFGLGYGAYLGSSWALISDVLPDAQSIATDMGVWAMSLTVAQTLAGFCGGAVDALNASSAGMGYMVVFLTGAVMFFLGSVAVKAIKGST